MNRDGKNHKNEAQRVNDSISPRSGSLKRNNVYSPDDVRGWAARIRCGPGGIKMNQKFMLIAIASSSNPRGISEVPVRYLADYIGVGMRQAQRIILELSRLELISFIDLPPEGRPLDVVRKFSLNTVIDPDTWAPKDATTSYTTRQMLRVPRQAFLDSLNTRIPNIAANRHDLMLLSSIYPIGVRSKQFDFVSPDVEATNAWYRWQKVILEIASEITQSKVVRTHLIPRKGYRG
jgi:hypothetical protein